MLCLNCVEIMYTKTRKLNQAVVYDVLSYFGSDLNNGTPNLGEKKKELDG